LAIIEVFTGAHPHFVEVGGVDGIAALRLLFVHQQQNLLPLLVAALEVLGLVHATQFPVDEAVKDVMLLKNYKNIHIYNQLLF
jgi:hypothetical protein